MGFSLRSRAPRWAAQPSTFYLLLNICLLSGLLHYWTWDTRVTQWIPTSGLDKDKLLEYYDRHGLDPKPLEPEPVARVPDRVVAKPDQLVHTPSSSTLPGFCNLCGPDDFYCRKYGADLLARSIGFEGANARFRRVLRDASAGKPVKIAILGGSVTAGHGVKAHENWVNIFGDWWKKQFPQSQLTLQNGAVPAVGTGYMSVCYGEHIDADADVVITEFAINENRSDESATTYELLLRQLLLLPKQPAVLNLQVFALVFPTITRGGDVHTAVAQYYDTPVINLRNAILPQLLVNTTARDDFFHNILNTGNMDYRHIGWRGHEMAGELLASYTQRQLCAIAQRDTIDASTLHGSSLAAQLPLDMSSFPTQSMFGGADDPPAPVLNPFCSSTRNERNLLVPTFNDGRWSNYTWIPPNGNKAYMKSYIVPSEPGALIGFTVPVRGGLGRVRVQYLRSWEYGLGIARCWLDDLKTKAVNLDGYWTHKVNVAAFMVIATGVSSGDHMIWCEMTGHSTSPDKKTGFRIMAVDSA